MSAPSDGRPRVEARRAGPGPATREVRAWALSNGIRVARSGGLPRFVYELYVAAQPQQGGAPGAEPRPEVGASPPPDLDGAAPQ